MPCVPTATNSCSIDAAGCLWFSACRPSRALIFRHRVCSLLRACCGYSRGCLSPSMLMHGRSRASGVSTVQGRTWCISRLLVHDLKLPDTCMLVHFFRVMSFIWPLLMKLPDTCMLVHFFRVMSFIWPLLMALTISPESPARFRLWSCVGSGHLSCCERRLHWLKLSGHHADSVRDLLC